MRIPETYVCTFAMYDNYLQNREETVSTLRDQLFKVVNGQKKYSIRSSANVEDESDHSFAGQFQTSLNTVSLDNIIAAVVGVWKSCHDERVYSYLQRIGVDMSNLKMAVIIQEMVDSKLSGVAFTRNPVTGMDESIIEYVSGLGDSLVQSGTTPSRWVYKWGSWIEIPEEQEDAELMLSVLVEAKKIERKYGKPVDLEWTYDGQDLYWLQIREITTVTGINIYSNRISKEFLPGIIKPLIWSVNIPVVNTSWKQLLIELAGKSALNIDINNLAKSFYYRSYFNMGIIGDIFELLGMPRESLELLMGVTVTGGKRPKMKPGLRVMSYIPRVLVFAASKMLFSRKIRKFFTLKPQIYYQYGNRDISSLDEKET
ncbi:MAG: hypothetical protein JSV32_00140, partial [Dehalococcoidia bacterium]